MNTGYVLSPFIAALEWDVWKRKDDLEGDRNSYVYFIAEEGDDTPFKLGVAVNPVDRLSTLQQANSRTLLLLAAVPGGAKLEAYLHHVLRRDRIRGEWFRRSRRGSTLIEEFQGLESTLRHLELDDFGPAEPNDTLMLICSRVEDALWMHDHLNAGRMAEDMQPTKGKATFVP